MMNGEKDKHTDRRFSVKDELVRTAKNGDDDLA